MIEWNLLVPVVLVSVLTGVVIVFTAGWRADRKGVGFHLNRWKIERDRRIRSAQLLEDAAEVIEWYTSPTHQTNRQTGTELSFYYYELGRDVLSRHRYLKSHQQEEVV